MTTLVITLQEEEGKMAMGRSVIRTRDATKEQLLFASALESAVVAVGKKLDLSVLSPLDQNELNAQAEKVARVVIQFGGVPTDELN